MKECQNQNQNLIGKKSSNQPDASLLKKKLTMKRKKWYGILVRIGNLFDFFNRVIFENNFEVY